MHSKQETDQFWDAHIQACTASGLTRAAYCDREGLSLNQLIHQKRQRARLSAKPAQRSSSGFAAVALADPTTGLSIAFPSGVQLSGIDASNLAVVKSLLEALA